MLHNSRPALGAAMTLLFHVGCKRRGASEFCLSAAASEQWIMKSYPGK
jgi:hypothetical protein